MKKLMKSFLQDAADQCGAYPEKVRSMQPLVHLITNYVTVTDCVNAVLASGGKAICSHAPEEAAGVTSGADALVLNLGGTEYYDAMERSAAIAPAAGIPLVIDPVGCAASDYRLKMCLHLTQTYHPAAIRGNYAEIAALTDEDAKGALGQKPSEKRSGSKGLDSTESLSASEESHLAAHMKAFAKKYGTILIASGKTDLVTDGERFREVAGGTPALKRITGAGCLSTGLVAAFLASAGVPAPGGSGSARDIFFDAVVSAVRYVSLAGEYAKEACRKTGEGAGHFHMYFLDFISAGDEVWE